MEKRTDIDKAIRNVMNWASRPEWAAERVAVFEEHIAPVCDRMDLDLETLSEELGDSGYDGMLFGIAFEDFATRQLPPDSRNLIDDYLERRGWREAPRGRAYLRELRKSVLSVYEVVAVSRGEYCDLQDLFLGGKPVRVHERMGTQNLAKWDRLAGRVLTMEGRHIFSGGVLPLGPDTAQSVLNMLNNSRKNFKKELRKVADQAAVGHAVPPETVDRQLLETACPAIASIWLMHTLTQLRAPLPTMVNRDGEELVFSETRFPFLADHLDEIAQRLDADPEWERTTSDEHIWHWLPQAKAGARKASRKNVEAGYTINGTLELRPGELQFTANSIERTEKGKRLLEKRLKGLIGPALSSLQTPEQLMADEQQNQRRKPEVDNIDPQPAADIVKEFLDKHYRQSLDEPIPMLGDKTPRQCAKTKKGREKVIEWLKYLENSEQRRAAAGGQKPYDTGWMWEELKLTE
jgi:hypothetical protein